MPASVISHAAFTHYRAARAAAMAQFQSHHRIQTLWRELTRATDVLLAQVAGEAGLTLLAVGGYGRSELFPFSDVDVLVVAHASAATKADDAIARVLQQLWDMQIPVSHATRSIEETVAAAQRDSTVAAALMDARLIAGDRKAYLALKRRLRGEVFGMAPREFVAAKLSERDRRHSKWGDSRFMLEPNVKEGKGGLRDLHTLNWLARYCYRLNKVSELVREDLLTDAEWKHYREAYLFFANVRAHMHILRGRADERLTFDLQTRIASDLHFPGKTLQEKAEKFMLRYFSYAREVGAITRIFCTVLEEENLRHPTAPFVQEMRASGLSPAFTIDHGRLQFAAPETLLTKPALLVELFHLAQQYGLDIHPRAHLAIARALPVVGNQLPLEAKANQLFLDMLLSPKAPEMALRRMSEMGVLAALIPEFGRITGMMQYDGYHTYTVDEHTLVAIGHLAAIEAGSHEKEMPLTTKVAAEITDRAALYLAMLCHDLAKGTGGLHAEKGEMMVARVALRLQLSPAQATLAGWLVKHHLLLSETAFKRDLDDPKTIRDFVDSVQSPERLRLLLLVTVADVKAVGPSIWNRWKGGLMRDLYHRAMVEMGIGFPQISPPEQAREVLLRELSPAMADAAQRYLVDQFPASFWHRPREEQMAVVEAYDQWNRLPTRPALVIHHDRFRAVSEITCCDAYTPDLFRMLAGVMAWIGASIVSARSMVLSGGAMVTTFGIQNVEGNSFAEDEARLEPLAMLISAARIGTLDFVRELPRRRMLQRGRDVHIAPSVFIDNQVSASASVVEVNARDRLGLLYDILGALAECGLQVMTAHIATYGKKAVDVFYIKDAYGMKVIHRMKMEQVQQVLMRACGENVIPAEAGV